MLLFIYLTYFFFFFVFWSFLIHYQPYPALLGSIAGNIILTGGQHHLRGNRH